MLYDATEKVKEKSCYALEAFCENLGDDILPFLEPLLEKLTQLLQNSSSDTQQMAISALASVALAAGTKFRPHFARVFAFMRVLLHQTGDEALLLRARAMECIGVMNLAVGREHCEPVLHECVTQAIAGLELDLPELKEYTYGFFGQLAELIGAEIGPILPQIMPKLLASLDAEDAISMDSPGDGEQKSGLAAVAAALTQKGGGASNGNGLSLPDDTNGDEDEEDEDEEFDDDDDGEGRTFSVRTALLDEKTSAAMCIGECAKHAGAAFAPHIESSLRSLWDTAGYFHPEVRGSSVRALAYLVTAAAKAENLPKWVKGQMQTVESLPQATRAIHDQVTNALVKIFAEDDDKDVVAAASEALSEIATGLGPAGIAHLATKLTSVVIKLLKQKHPCMQDEEDDLADDLDPDADHDNALWEAVSDLLTNMPKVLGDAWLVHFSKLLPVLKPYLASGHPPRDRSLAIGILAESLHQLEGAGTGFFNDLLPLALRSAGDTDDVTTRQNGTFCIGVLGLHGGAAALHQMQAMLTALQPRLDGNEDPAVRDNAVGALARLVLAFGGSLPLAQIVPAIVTSLPLQADCGENIPSCRCLMALAQDENARGHLGPHMPQVLSVMATLANRENTDKLATAELQSEIMSFLEWLLSVAPEQKQYLPPELGGSGGQLV